MNSIRHYLLRLWRGPALVPLVLAVWGAAWLIHAHHTFDFKPVPNSEGFVSRSEISLWSREFYFAVRPFVTSLMYKLYTVKGRALIEAQLQFSAVAWLLLTWVLSLSIRSPLGRFAHSLLFPLLLAWWGIAGWNFAIRSESTAFAFLALWLGTLLLTLRQRTAVRVTALAVASFFFCFTRDNVPLIVLPTVFLVIAHDVWAFLRSKDTGKYRRKLILAIGLGAAMVLTAGFQLQTIQSAKHPLTKSRHEFPLANIVIRRILPDKDVREWFSERGMPVHEEILSWRKRWASGNDFSIFKDERYLEFRLWLRHEGKYTYVKYLITHPGYAMKRVIDDRNTLFRYEFPDYAGKPQTRSPVVQAADMIFPLFTPSLAFLLALGAALVSWKQRWGLAIPTIAFVVLLGFANAGAIYHLDAMEIPRHCAMVMPLFQACSYILLLLLNERFLSRRQAA